jgi:hypothetical protein
MGLVKMIVSVEVHREVETPRIVNGVFKDLHDFIENLGVTMLSRQHVFRSIA